MTKVYKTPIAFKTAVDQRLKRTMSDGNDLVRRRQLLVFDRFLARVMDEFAETVVLKGGLALELRLQQARSTTDVDVRISGDPEQLLARLQRAGRSDLGDFMSFQVGLPKKLSIQGAGIKYDGKRFRAECRIAGKIFGRAFGVDVGIGDPMITEPDEVMAVDRLDFAGIAPPRLRLYPVETHLAEKLHAYTLPRANANSRVKDLPDIALIGRIKPLVASRLARALAQTFEFRDTHPIPPRLPPPPKFWQAPYAEMVREFGLKWSTIDIAHEQAGRFLDPVLAGNRAATWDPEAWAWR